MRTVIYNRCSTEEEAQINALEIQASESREIVSAKGWILVDQYIESESGTSVHKRTEYQRLIEDMEIDKFDLIVIKSIDRLMRSAMDWYLFIYKLTQYNKKLYIYIDHKFYTPDDSLINGIKAILAEDFSRELSKKIKNAHRRRQEKKSGLNITKPMFGWNKISKDVYEINEEEAVNYRLAFELVREGMGFYRLSNWMFEHGVRGKNGNKITDVQWRHMLYSPRAHGTVVLHKREYDFDTKKYIAIPEEEWVYVENGLPPIVSKEYQTEVLQIIAGRTTKNVFKDYARNMTSVGLHALSGKLICSECGSPYYRTKLGHSNNRIVEWKCSRSLKQGKKTEENIHGCTNCNIVEETMLRLLEDACKQHYEALFGNEENIMDEALNTLRQVFHNGNHEKTLAKHEKELEKLNRRKKVLYDKWMDEMLSDEEFKKIKEELMEKIYQTEAVINSIKVKKEENKDYEERLVKIKEYLADEAVNKAKVKEIISAIKKITVYPDKMLEIEFDKLRLLSLIEIYSDKRLDDSDESFIKIKMKYEHKYKIERQREETNQFIIEYFRKNPEAKLKDIPLITNKSESYINASIRILKAKGMLKYERYGNHNGRWIITDCFVRST